MTVPGLESTDCTGVVKGNADLASERKQPPGADKPETPPLPIYPQPGDLPTDTTRTPA